MQDFAGNRGLYVLAFVSGLTDVDAITLSSLRLYALERLELIATVTAVGIAMLANLGFKLGMAIVIGGRALGLAPGDTVAITDFVDDPADTAPDTLPDSVNDTIGDASDSADGSTSSSCGPCNSARTAADAPARTRHRMPILRFDRLI